MPDAKGNIRGIRVPELPWLREEKIAGPRSGKTVAHASADLKAWEEARTHVLREHRWAGTD